MAVEKDFELLDDYLTNRLVGDDKSTFERKLDADPELKKELDIQQSLVQSIRQARINELKSMLNNVPTSAIPNETSKVVKIISGITLACLIAAGIYFFTNKESDTLTADKTGTGTPQQSTSSPVTDNEQGHAKTPSVTPASASKDIEQPKADKAPVKTKADVAAQPSASAPGKTSTSPGELQFDVYVPSDEDSGNKSAGITTDKPTASASKENKSSIVVETDNTNKKYTFHYQFKNDRLWLYGKFEKNLYEIMEFFTDNKRTIFLYYQDSFYLLEESQTKPTPLAAIADPVLLQKLKEFREN